MERGKEPLPLPYTYTSSTIAVGLLQHLQYYQKCEHIISKLKHIVSGWKLFCVCDNHVIITYWLKKGQEKYSFFLKTPSLDGIFLGALSNSIILVEDLIGWKKSFGIFLIDHYAGDIGNKNTVGKCKKIIVSMFLAL